MKEVTTPDAKKTAYFRSDIPYAREQTAVYSRSWSIQLYVEFTDAFSIKEIDKHPENNAAKFHNYFLVKDHGCGHYQRQDFIRGLTVNV